MSLLFSKTSLGSFTLQNRMVMSPMTRNRAENNTPNALMAQYYAQRGSAGLIVTEGTSPSPDGLGYPRIPGAFSAAQVAGWKLVTTAVHPLGAKMFMQLMHCGRIAHPLNLPASARVTSPFGDRRRRRDVHRCRGHEAVPDTGGDDGIGHQGRHRGVRASGGERGGGRIRRCRAARSQRLSDRTIYSPEFEFAHKIDPGGAIENRARFVLEVVDASIAAIGKDKVGIRLSPFGVFNDMPIYPSMEADYTYLAHELDKLGLMYAHLVDHSAMGAPPVPDSIKATFRSVFKRSLILSGGYDAVRAESDLEAGKCDLVAFARPFLANPDLVTRWGVGCTHYRARHEHVLHARPQGLYRLPDDDLTLLRRRGQTIGFLRAMAGAWHGYVISPCARSQRQISAATNSGFHSMMCLVISAAMRSLSPADAYSII